MPHARRGRAIVTGTWPRSRARSARARTGSAATRTHPPARTSYRRRRGSWPAFSTTCARSAAGATSRRCCRRRSRTRSSRGSTRSPTATAASGGRSSASRSAAAARAGRHPADEPRAVRPAGGVRDALTAWRFDDDGRDRWVRMLADAAHAAADGSARLADEIAAHGRVARALRAPPQRQRGDRAAGAPPGAPDRHQRGRDPADATVRARGARALNQLTEDGVLGEVTLAKRNRAWESIGCSRSSTSSSAT